MTSLLFCGFLIGLTLVLAQDRNPPEFKFAFDYDVVEMLKYNLVKPLIEKFTQDLTINKTFVIEAGVISGELGNITISNLDLDWDHTHLLILDQSENPVIILHNLSFSMKFDAGASYLQHSFLGHNNHVVIQDADVTIDLGFGMLPDETTYIYIDGATVSIKAMDLRLSNPILEVAILATKLFGIKIQNIASTFIQNGILELNNTLVEMTSQGLQFGLLDLLDVEIALADLPFAYNLNGNAHQAISFNLDVVNMETNQPAPVAAADVMPDYIANSHAIQLFISQSMVAQILWGAFQTDLIKIELSNDKLPAGSPISLNTTVLTILFPNIAIDYGNSKGIYLKIQKGGEDPLVFITDGRISAEVNLELEFWVDTDSSQYPTQGLTNCTTCQKAVAVNTFIFVQMVLYQQNATYIGVKMMNLQLNQLQVLFGDVNASALSATLNNLFIPLLVQINTQLQYGIRNPLIGFLGVNDTSLSVGTDYLLIGMSFGPSSNQLILN